MSSHEPDPDDEDTGPLYVEKLQTPAAEERRFDAPLSVHPRPVQHDNRPVVLIATATVAVAALGTLAWLFWPSSDGSDTPVGGAGATSASRSPQQAEAQLSKMVPRGYPPQVCETVVPAKGAAAQISCGKNDDPGGPQTATFTLAESKGAVTELLDEVVSTTSVVNCPGNIQSPGPWRRNATPQQPAGTLVCGFQQSKPTIAWTTNGDQLVSKVQSGPQGPNLVQLYTWWASHS